MQTELKNVDSLANTPFGALFHAARTTSKSQYSGVSVAVNVADDGIEVGDVVKTRQGEHYHVRNSNWDAVISLPVRAFMKTSVAKSEISRQLKRVKRTQAARK